MTVSLNQDLLFKMRVHPTQPHLFATGGDERELCVWDITKFIPSETSTMLPVLKPIWTAKNVPHTPLDMRVPVWITDIQWLPETQTVEGIVKHTTCLVSGTGYHHIRSYNTNQKKPLYAFESGEHPIKSIATTNNW